MKRFHPALVLLAFLGQTACLPDNRSGKSNSQDKYIALPAYFVAEKTHLLAANLVLHKTAVLNGQRESSTIAGTDSTAIQDLLKPFTDADLNKPSLRDEYDTSSLYDPFSGSRSYIYKSKGRQTNPAEITLEMDKHGIIQRVNIHAYTSNQVYEFRQDLAYLRNKRINITTYQKIAFLSSKEVEIDVTMAPKNEQQ
ncbi:hypothetical protein [Chitinophaga nivalis]|uniref:Uncharacterized protein n=1 Tax=Chitinophaga nivalis TaxID=2991709 RepID=A0ABT3IUE3_9BACT|nr:hypothetical protein [Chitinophaga nivalis]MCW3462697.1 hypothetical protein [Chitinophaga nivalis]MCW3487612.1 hypothetical protein [Chitinophaga nivalis]